MFRWFQDADGSWTGCDGDRWWTLTPEGERWTVQGNAGREPFEAFFGLEVPFSRFRQEVLARGAELEPYLDGLPGLRLLRPADPEETFATFLCSANNSLHRIVPMAHALATRGKPLTERLRQFPALEVIARISEEELRAQGFGYRARTIPLACGEIVARGGRRYLDGLKQAPYEEAWRALAECPGVGRKLADCILLFGLEHRNAVPVDTHIWQALTRLYHPEWQGQGLTAVRYAQAADAFRARFGPWAGWAHQFLFFDNVLHGRARRKERG